MEERILDLSYGRKDLGSILWKKGSWIYPMEERILDLSHGRKDQIIIEAFTDLGSILWKKGSWIYPMEKRIRL